MDAAAVEVLKVFGDVRIAFGESDEYSFVFHKGTSLYNRRASKLSSLVVSCFSSAYTRYWGEHLPGTPLRSTPVFDARAICYPSDQSLRDYLAWRQVDTHINNQARGPWFGWKLSITQPFNPQPSNPSTVPQYNTCYWALRQQGGKSAQEAQLALKGTLADAKNELLFSQFGINYAKLPERFRKGSVVLRLPETQVVRIGDGGEPITRTRRAPAVLHVDIIGDAFWREHPELLQ